MYNPFKPEFTIVIFIQYKPWIAAAIVDLYWMKMIWSGWKSEEKFPCIGKPVSWNFLIPKTLVVRKLNLFSGMWNDALINEIKLPPLLIDNLII